MYSKKSRTSEHQNIVFSWCSHVLEFWKTNFRTSDHLFWTCKHFKFCVYWHNSINIEGKYTQMVPMYCIFHNMFGEKKGFGSKFLLFIKINILLFWYSGTFGMQNIRTEHFFMFWCSHVLMFWTFKIHILQCMGEPLSQFFFYQNGKLNFFFSLKLKTKFFFSLKVKPNYLKKKPPLVYKWYTAQKLNFLLEFLQIKISWFSR